MPGGDRRVLQCCEAIKLSLNIDVLAIPAAVIWLGAVFMELEFRLLCENAEMSFALQKQKTALAMKGQRAQRAIMLMAHSYECATRKKAAAPYRENSRGEGRLDGPFFRFVKIVAQNSTAPILGSCSDLSFKGLIERGLKLRDDAAQRQFEVLAWFNALYAMPGAHFPHDGGWLKWRNENQDL
ncbi:MAG: hypothetical protein ACREDT_14340 [Methylocella sp.]